MSLEFKKIEVNSIQEMLPFYAMRHNMTCDSVFLESYVWKIIIMSAMQSGKIRRFYG
mgnify:FL=1